jgi:hypothetical protein
LSDKSTEFYSNLDKFPFDSSGMSLRGALASFRRLERISAFHPLLKFKLRHYLGRRPSPAKKFNEIPKPGCRQFLLWRPVAAPPPES